MLYPMLIMPKKCTVQEVTDNTIINLSITSSNNEVLYSGFCRIKLLDSYDVSASGAEEIEASRIDIRDASISSSPDAIDIDQIQVVEASSYSSYPPHSQSQVWIDPDRSPFVFNNYHTPESQSRYSVYHQTHSSHIANEQHNTYITQNVYNYPEPIYSFGEEFELEKFKENQMDDKNPLNEDIEFECGVSVLSRLSKEIMNEKEAIVREELHYIGLQSEDDASKQLISSDIQAMSKQQKTILFLGPDSHFGRTIQEIAVNDPSLECIAGGESDQEIIVGVGRPRWVHSNVSGPGSSSSNVSVPGSSSSSVSGSGSSSFNTKSRNKNRPYQKKYQCDKCMQTFNQIAAFKQHMVSTHKQSKDPEVSSSKGEVKFKCFQCGKSLKSQEKFELHCLGHGDPDRECNKCGKVFASKFTLRTHKKIHNRQYRCDHCTKAFASRDELLAHAAKDHFVFACNDCEFTANKYEDLMMHKCHCQVPLPACSDVPCRLTECANSPLSTFAPSISTSTQRPTRAEIRKADSIIANVMSNKVFLLHAKKARKDKRCKKVCDVCSKTFARIGDLKRHLIEHVIKSTLAKNPVNEHGILNIQCEICHEKTFNKVDRYKAHLRDHAKLTLYQCTSCNKSFSDSSNFCKHKKVHGAPYFQCDLCQRKFNSKRMITQHMEYHDSNSPIPCFYCNKEFYFESMLNKHIKYAHIKEIYTHFRCKLCHQHFKTLKEKWDHEWDIHNVRKMIIDCQICGSQFRKYSDMKRHCKDTHDLKIPRAKKLLKNKSSN